MRKSITLLLSASLIVAVISGCSSVSQRGTTVISRSSDFTADVLNQKIEPISEVGRRISGTARISYIFGIIPVGENASMYDTSLGWIFGWKEKMVRDAAEYALFENSNADFLVAPKYRIKKDNYILWTVVESTVTGFKGTYKGFKVISIEKQKELGLLKNGVWINKL